MPGSWRRYLAGSLAGLLMAGLFPLGALADATPIVSPVQGPGQVVVQDGRQPVLELNGSLIDLTAEVADDGLYLPLRAIGEALGFEVGWSEGDQRITLNAPSKNIGLSLKEAKIQVNGHEMYTLGNFKMINDLTYLAEDFFADQLGLNINWDRARGEVTLNSVAQNPVVIKNQKEFSETQTLKSTVQYPQLNGVLDSEVQQKLNTSFAGLAAKAKQEGLKNEKDLDQDAITRHIKAETYFNYQVKYNQNGILSLVFSDYQYSGGAHGITVQSSHTFDMKTGNEYKLKDLFREDADYVSVISQEVKQQMQDRGMTVLLSPFNFIKTDQDFYLTNKALVVYFQQYEYFPYAFGIPEFAVDFSLLQDSINPTFGFLGVTQPTQAPAVNAAAFKDQGLLAFVWQGLLYTLDGQTGAVKAVTESGQALYPAWSPDGQWLAFIRVIDPQAQNGQLWITRKDGSQVHQVQGLPGLVGPRDFAWSPAADVLAVSTENGLWLVPTEGEPRRAADQGGTAWSPDGKSLTYSATLPFDSKNPEERSDALYTIAVEGGQPVKHIEAAQAGIMPAGWWPDGKGLLYWVDPLHSASIAADGLDLVSLRLGDAKPQVLTSGLINPDWLSFSPQGKLLMVKGGDRIVWAGKSLAVIDVAAGRVQDLPNPEGSVSLDPSFSPDGKHISFVAAKDLGNKVWGFGDSKDLGAWVATRTLWIEDADGGDAYPLASAGGGVYQPLWSKDGSRLLYVRDNALWMVGSEGGAPAKIVDLLPAPRDLFGFYGYLSFSDQFVWFRK